MVDTRINQNEFNPHLSLLRLMTLLLCEVEKGEQASKAETRIYRRTLTNGIADANNVAADQTAAKANMLSKSAFLLLAGALASMFVPSESVKQLLNTVANSLGPQWTNSLATSKDGSIRILTDRAQALSRDEYNLSTEKQKDQVESKVSALFDAIMRLSLAAASKGG